MLHALFGFFSSLLKVVGIVLEINRMREVTAEGFSVSSRENVLKKVLSVICIKTTSLSVGFGKVE